MKGITKLIRNLNPGETVTTTGTARSNLYRLARENKLRVSVHRTGDVLEVTCIGVRGVDER